MTFVESIRTRAAMRPRTIVFSELEDDRTIAALKLICAEKLLHPVAVGDSGSITRRLHAAGIPADDVVIVDPVSDPRHDVYAHTLYTARKARGLTLEDARTNMRDPLFFAAMMVRHDDAEGSVAGAVRTTADVLRAAIFCVGPAAGIKSVSSSFYMVVPPFRTASPEVLTFTDCGVIPEPTEAQLADIAEAAVIARRRIVGDEPRVAFLSFSTHGSGRSRSTARVQTAVTRFRTRCPNVIVDGELQADAALVQEIAERKAPGSPVAGGANVLVFPSLDAGNIAYKLVQRLAHATAIGPVLQGLGKPCNDLSRGSTADDIVNVACITALQAGPGTE